MMLFPQEHAYDGHASYVAHCSLVAPSGTVALLVVDEDSDPPEQATIKPNEKKVAKRERRMGPSIATLEPAFPPPDFFPSTFEFHPGTPLAEVIVMSGANERDHGMFRRAFLGGALALAACKKTPPRDAPKEGQAGLAPPPTTSTQMPQRPLGQTGVKVSLIGLGGYHLGIPKDDAEAVRIIRTAIDRGVTFLDNCWDYHDGKSEERMGRALADGYRQRAFLMTKIDGRTKKVAAEQLHQSLQRLGTDMIDLVQIHEVIRMSDPARCFADDGCIHALTEAKKAGKLRFIGFTGHKDPAIHLAMLKAADEHGFKFDTVQLPLNVMDAHYRSFEKEVLPLLVQKGIGVLGMKALCSGKIAGKKLPNGHTLEAVECLHYAMSLPTSVVITGCDSMGVLEQAVSAALTFKPLDEGQTAALLAKTKDAAMDGKLETFKTGDEHDGTNRNPHWLETSNI